MIDSPKRVVIADDSTFLRGLLTSYLESSPDFEVIAVACNGREAVDIVLEQRPDVITLDVDMPVLSGLEALEQIMQSAPTPTVMVSGVSRRSADITLQAVKNGAVDFILKYVPGQRVDPELMRLDVISKVKSAADVRVVRSIPSRIPSGTTRIDSKSDSGPETAFKIERHSDNAAHAVGSEAESSRRRFPTSSFMGRYQGIVGHSTSDVVIIGASTGGPVAVKELLSELPIDFPLPIIVVQHMPQPFTAVFAEQINTQTTCRASVVSDGEKLTPGHVHIAPGDRHLILNSGWTLSVVDGPEICGHRPSIDVTMKSIAQGFAGQIYGVVLTGMGEDGASGLSYIKAKGGRTFAQSPETCVVNGMPNKAIALKAVDFVGPPAAIAEQLTLDIVHRQLERKLNSAPLDPATSLIKEQT